MHKMMELIRERLLFLDGAMGTMLQQAEVQESDFLGLEGCNEILVESRPDVIKAIHAAYLEAGADLIETNTFGANGVVLAEYGIADKTRDLNLTAALLAREVADSYSTPSRPRFVVGSVGPGTRLPSLGHASFAELVAAFESQFAGLIEGGVDAVCIETCQDILQVKSALLALRSAASNSGRMPVVIVSITIESTGTMLLGSDVQTAVSALLPMKPDILGLNCATGPAEMKRHLEALARSFGGPVMAMPNAGLPLNVRGQVVYPLGPEEFADWAVRFVEEDGVSLMGGCCGTTPAHIQAATRRLQGRRPPKRSLPAPAPELSSLYQTVSMRQVPAPLLVGERANANGSKAFRERLLADDLQGMLDIAREQEHGGAHILDVCVAYVGRDERADMANLVPLLARNIRLPLSIDSTDPTVIETALRLHGGRCLINSINLEDGEQRFHQIATLASSYGAALIALTIDETGMAMTKEAKLQVAERMIALAAEHGLKPADLLIDLLTFTVGSGDPATRNAAVETLDAMAELKKRYPDVGTILGVSNVSFGLKPAARRILNSVFLHLAIERGLDAAIVNARGILPVYRIGKERLDAATALLLNDRSNGDPLMRYMALFDGEEVGEAGGEGVGASTTPLSAEERLQKAVVDGSRGGLEGLLNGLLEAGNSPVSIINEMLIPAMKRVGELFGAGQMQLPFVLQSAETMKAAVAHLEPHMEKTDSQSRGTLVIATVKGDVHDIGKNLVDIIVSNNGYKVVNLGIKVPLEEMIAAVRQHDATALGMSGLLVKSTVVMLENLQEMARRGIKVPVLLGGAALTREYVETTLRSAYGKNVHYCNDAFDGLGAMNSIVTKEGSSVGLGEEEDPLTEPRSTWSKSLAIPSPGTSTQLVPEETPVAPEVDYSVPVPEVDSYETRVIRNIPLGEVFALLNETTLFRGQWRYRRGTLSAEAYATLVREQVRPALEALKSEMVSSGVMVPQAVYRYVRCHAHGNTTFLEGVDGRPLGRFDFPRQGPAPHRCISDYFRRRGTGKSDVLGLFVVTVGADVAREVQRLFKVNRYRDYLHLHGLAVETAEATAEWLHLQMRREMGIAPELARSEQVNGNVAGATVALEGQALVRQGYRGSRYSFGYPACPDLDDQRTLFRLLEPSAIGVELSETCQMVPEYSVSAVVVHHPDAKYFAV